MAEMPSREEQIVQTHAALIVLAARAAGGNPEAQKEIGPVLDAFRQHGQPALADAVASVIAGEREARTITGVLDADDTVVIEAILRGIQDPATLPDPEQTADPSAAAPGLAHLIKAAGSGNAEALQILSGMAEQMTAVGGGDMAQMGGIMRRLVNGERDPEVLCKKMTARGESLVLSILEELGRLEQH